MFCTRCGSEIDNKAVVCVHCGRAVSKSRVTEQDAPSPLFALLGFFFPIAGFVLYLAFKSSSPRKAKSAGKWALIGLILKVVLSIVFAVIYFLGVIFLTSELLYYFN